MERETTEVKNFRPRLQNSLCKISLMVNLISAMPMACTVGELLAKNIEKTARRQLEGQHLLFGEYLRS